MTTAAVLGTLVALTLAPAPAQARVPNLSWTSLLGAGPSPASSTLPSSPGCRKPAARCVDYEIREMRRLQRRLGCDHRAVFATTYLELTKVLRDTLRSEPGLFRFPRALFAEDALFADYYFDTIRADDAGRVVPAAWRIAFDVARRGQVPAITDVLLGINAHVQRDMPYVLARLGLRDGRGFSRKVDHDRFNAILNRAYEQVIHTVADRFDPSVDLTNPDATPLDDLAGQELVRAWRENVWRNAERLSNARTAADRRRVEELIELNAATTARMVSLGSMPGYRSRRDAYCAARLASARR